MGMLLCVAEVGPFGGFGVVVFVLVVVFCCYVLWAFVGVFLFVLYALSNVGVCVCSC